jgi:hypothetical protein
MGHSQPFPLVLRVCAGLLALQCCLCTEAADLTRIKKGDRIHLLLDTSAISPVGIGQADCEVKIVGRHPDHFSVRLRQTVPECGSKHEIRNVAFTNIGGVERRQVSGTRRAGTVLVTTAAVLGFGVMGVAAAGAASGGAPGIAAVFSSIAAGGPMLFWIGRPKGNKTVFVRCPAISPCLPR